MSCSTIDEEHDSCGLLYRLKRRRGLTPVDGSEPNAVEPAPKRLAIHREDEDEGSMDTLSAHDDEYIGLDLEETFAAYEADIFNSSSVTKVANEADLLCAEGSDKNFQSPPSSVLRAHCRGSRSGDEFDPNLQNSPSERSTTLTVGSEDEPVLDQEIDWESVYEHIQGCPKDPSLVGSGEARRRHTAKPHQEANTPVSSTLASSPPQTWATKSFQDMRLTPHKTFFHVKEMLQTKVDMFKNQPEATFELFARVVYSSRENFTSKQYFQFRDLFKETPPYLCGVLLA